MECKNIKKKLIFLVEKSLGPDEEKQLLFHLESCALCREQYEFFKGIENLIIEKKSKDVSPYFFTKLSGRLESISSPEQSELRPAWIRIMHGGILAMIIIVAIISGFLLGKNDSKYSNNKQTAKKTDNTIQKEFSVYDNQFADNFPTY